MPTCNSCGSSYTGEPRFCPSCGSLVQHSKAQSTPAASGNAGKVQSSARRIGMIVFGVLLLFGVGFFIFFITPSVHEVIQKQPVVAEVMAYDTNTVTMTNVLSWEEGSDLVFSLRDLKQHRLVRFEYIGRTTPRNIMAYIASDGRLVTAISLSEHCGSTEFEIKGNHIRCARCPSYWDMMTMEAYACCAQYYPDPIPSRVVDDEVHVSKEVVERWVGRL